MTLTRRCLRTIACVALVWGYAQAQPVPPLSFDRYMSSLAWTSAANGLGPVERDQSNGGAAARDGRMMVMDGRTYAKGLGVYGDSSVSFAVPEGCTQFRAVVGIDDFYGDTPVGARGSVRVFVIRDSAIRFESPTLTGSTQAVPVTVDVAGARELRLVTESTADGSAFDIADWADARFVCTPPLPARVQYEQTILRENRVEADGRKVELSTWTVEGGTYVNWPVRTGSHAVSVLRGTTRTRFWASSFNTTFSFRPFDTLSFWVYSPVANPAIRVSVGWQDNAAAGDINLARTDGPSVPISRGIAARTWTRITIPVAILIPDPAHRHSVVRLDLLGDVPGGVFVDDLSLLGSQPARASVRVDASDRVRAVDPRLVGTGLAYWNGDNNSSRAIGYVAALGVGALRFSNDSNTRRFQGGGFSNSHLLVTANPQAALYTILHGWNATYGVPASVAEAKALVAYLRLPAASDPRGAAAPLWDKRSVPIDAFDAAYEVWEGSTPRVVQYREAARTAGWWADLRAAAPLAEDDGLNGLRLGRQASFPVRYFELDNEPFWNAPPAPTLQEYVAWVKRLMAPDGIKQIDPGIRWGVPTTGSGHNGTWDLDLFTALAATPSLVPDFISHHHYAPGWDDYEALFSGLPADDGDPRKGANGTWPMEAFRYRAIIAQAYGGRVAPDQVELALTESNISEGSNGNQSLTAALYFADQAGALLNSSFSAWMTFHLRGGTVTPAGTYTGARLYGWQKRTSYGMIQDDLPEPRTPHYWGMALASQLVRHGGAVQRTSSDNLLVSAYATRGADGSLNLLLVNKAKTQNILVDLSLAGFDPRPTAVVTRFGKPEDAAAQRGAVTLATSTLANASRSFSVALPAYSASVIRFTLQ